MIVQFRSFRRGFPLFSVCAQRTEQTDFVGSPRFARLRRSFTRALRAASPQLHPCAARLSKTHCTFFGTEQGSGFPNPRHLSHSAKRRNRYDSADSALFGEVFRCSLYARLSKTHCTFFGTEQGSGFPNPRHLSHSAKRRNRYDSADFALFGEVFRCSLYARSARSKPTSSVRPGSRGFAAASPVRCAP